MTGRFDPVTLTPEQSARVEEVRKAAAVLDEVMARLCPASRERSLAITNLEQAAMWAVKSIAHEPRVAT